MEEETIRKVADATKELAKLGTTGLDMLRMPPASQDRRPLTSPAVYRA